jgi:CAAX amino terminal protease family.
LKDAAKLIVYFLAVVAGGAILAPFLYGAAGIAVAHGIFPFLARYHFETFFHRALLICALFFLWPLFRSLDIHGSGDLGLKKNPHPWRDLFMGASLAGIPLLCAAVVLTWSRLFLLKTVIPWPSLATVAGAAIAVPLIEEFFFRGFILGILRRAIGPAVAAFITSAFFALVHFLKAPPRTNAVVTWYSGLNSIAHSFAQFADPTAVLAAFATLFVIGWILADARLRTQSLWLPIGLHGGWILVAGVFTKITKKQAEILPWLGNSLTVGIVPLGLAFLTGALMYWWLQYVSSRKT